MSTKKIILRLSQNNSGNQELIRAIQFSAMGGPLGDPWNCDYIHSTDMGHQKVSVFV